MLSYADIPDMVSVILGLFSFRMGWLLFKAGMFYKPRPMKEVIDKGIRRFVIPFVIFSLIGEPLMYIRYLSEEPTVAAAIIKGIKEASIALFAGGSLPGNLPLWFLLSLFGAKIIFSHCMTHRNYWLLTCALLVAPLDYVSGLKLPYYIASTSSALAFYAMGYLLRDFKPRSHLTVILLTGLWLAIAIFMPTGIDMRNNACSTGNYFLWYPTALVAILAINTLFRRYRITIRPLSHIGRNSMTYYVMHWPVILLVWHIWFLDTPHGTPWVAAVTLASRLLLPACNYLIRRSPIGKYV